MRRHPTQGNTVRANSSRRGLRRLGAVGAVALAGAVTLVAPARAAAPTPAPAGDDVAFVQFGAVAERVAQAYYRRALTTPRIFERAQRRRLALAHRQTLAHVARLNAVLGDDAVGPDDFAIAFAERAFDERARASRLGERIERLLLGVYLNGAAYAEDAATRLLLARLAASATTQLAALRAIRGAPPTGGLPFPTDLDVAGARLDTFLALPGSTA